MKSAELEAFGRTDYLNDGHAHVLDQARPHFRRLLSELAALPDDASTERRRQAFRRCVLSLNEMGDDIETVERECFCAALYALGEIVGLPEESQFVDEWRGDW